jgi:hypothetical protein
MPSVFSSTELDCGNIITTTAQQLQRSGSYSIFCSSIADSITDAIN